MYRKKMQKALDKPHAFRHSANLIHFDSILVSKAKGREADETDNTQITGETSHRTKKGSETERSDTECIYYQCFVEWARNGGRWQEKEQLVQQ